MAKLGYLKVGNVLKQSSSLRYSHYSSEDNNAGTIKIEELKINKTSVLINGQKYKIVGNKLVLDIPPVRLILSPIDDNYEFNDELERELIKLERALRSIDLFINSARYTHTPKERESLYDEVKALNDKLYTGIE